MTKERLSLPPRRRKLCTEPDAIAAVKSEEEIEAVEDWADIVEPKPDEEFEPLDDVLENEDEGQDDFVAVEDFSDEDEDEDYEPVRKRAKKSPRKKKAKEVTEVVKQLRKRRALDGYERVEIPGEDEEEMARNLEEMKKGIE